MGRLSGKVVVITGASYGVGRATVRAFAQAGANVALLARGVEALEHAAAEARDRTVEALVLPTDVSDAQAVFRAADQVARQFGRIDVWVNSAMVSVLAPVEEITPDEYRRVTEVTYLGYVHGTLAALRHMRPRNAGTIIQVGSALAYRSIPLQSAYCAAKAAIRGFTDSLRSELVHDRSRVKVCMVQLPALNTPQFEVMRTRLPNQPQPVPPIFQPEVAARAIVHAARHPSRELWVGGTVVQAILGQRIIPGLLDRYLAKRAYDGQQAPEPLPPGRQDNLYAPPPGDHGAHGLFGARASPRSTQLWLRRHRRLVGGAAIAAATLGLWLSDRGARRG